MEDTFFKTKRLVKLKYFEYQYKLNPSTAHRNKTKPSNMMPT